MVEPVPYLFTASLTFGRAFELNPGLAPPLQRTKPMGVRSPQGNSFPAAIIIQQSSKCWQGCQ